MIITTSFKGGNGNIVKTEKNLEGETIWFTAEFKKREPQAMWFHFRIKDVIGPKVQCILLNAFQCLGSIEGWAFNSLVYKAGNKSWQRIKSGRVYLDEHSIPMYAFDIQTRPNEHIIEVAFCFPYQSTNLQETLAKTNKWKTATIGYSLLQRPLIRIYNYSGDKCDKRQGVYFIARQHSGETTGSWVLDGVLQIGLFGSSYRDFISRS